MPIAEIQTPDGKVISLEVPEGATEQDILNFVESQDLSSFTPVEQTVEQQQTQPEAIQDEKTIVNQIAGGLSGAATLASDVIGTGAGGLTALVDILNPFTDNDPAQLIEQVKSKFKIDPSQGGEAALNQLGSIIDSSGAGDLLKSVKDFSDVAGQQGLDLTGSPAFATFVNIIPDIIAEVAGAGLVKRGATTRALKPVEEQAKRAVVTDIATIDKDTGIATFTSDAIPPETRLGKLMQSQGELVAGFQRKGQQAQRVKAVENLANQFDVIEGVGFEASIVQGLKDSVQASKQAIGELYDESTAKLDKLGAVPLINTKKFAQEVIERESKKGTLANQPVIDDMQTLLDAPDDLSFELVKEIRSSVGANLERVKRGAPVQGNTDTGLLKRIYGRLSGDMKSFAENADPILADKWKKANSTIEEFATGANKQGAKSIIKNGSATPEVVDTLLFSGKNSDVEFLAKNLDEAGKKAAKQRILQRALEKSSISGDDINPSKFLTQLNKTRNQIGKMFSPEERKAIFALRDQLTRTRRAQDAKVTTPTGQELVLPAAIVSGGLTLTPGIVQGIIESKPIRDLLIKRKAAKSARAITSIDAQLKSKIDELGLGGALATGAALTAQEQN